MNYYKKELLIPRVDEHDHIIGTVERWEAHTKGILHRGFTVGVFDTNRNMILQQRKHPVFDNYYDLTASSHQIYQGDTLTDVNEAIYQTLERESNMARNIFVAEPQLVGKVIYKSSDGTYTEHELCHLYTLHLTSAIPKPNKEYAYGYTVKPVDQILKAQYKGSNGLAPWVTAFFDKGLLGNIPIR